MIDASIALQARPMTQLIQPMDLAVQGMQLQRQSQINQASQKEVDDQKTFSDILKRNTVTDANGNSVVNKQASLSEFYKANPTKALEVDKSWKLDDLNQLKQHAEASYQLASQMTPENAPEIKQKAFQMGLPNWDKIPDQVSPEMIQRLQATTLHGALSAKEEIENQQKNRTADIQEKHYNLMYQDHKESRADKEEQKQGDYYQKASKDLETFRGNQAVQQANSALTNVANALSLADKGNLSKDQLHLFASEMAKLATGGVPGHSEIAALMPDTMQSRISGIQSFFLNNPTDADAQAFIDNNKGYLKELMKNYGDVVDKYRENTINGYSKKLSPEYIKELRDRNASSSYKAKFGAPAQGQQGPVSATAHPMVSEAEQWATANPNDPRAQEILKRIGK